MSLLRGFRLSGGVTRGEDLAALLSNPSGVNIGTLARWIVEGRVVHFDWQRETWIPLFQFSSAAMVIRQDVSPVLEEFRGVLDPWETAQWFASPSAALGFRTPADVIALNPDLVLQVARSDRYVVDA